MASKIIVDQLESSGSNITIPTGTGLVVTDGIAATNLSGTIADARLPTVPVAKGGTGLTSLGSAGQAVKVNSAGNALEFGAVGGGGKILQVIEDVQDGEFETSSSSFVATGLSVSITPSATTSKILIMAAPHYDSKGNRYIHGTLHRDSTELSAGNEGMQIAYQPDGERNQGGFPLLKLDSPNTTSQVTYSVKVRTNSGTMRIGQNNMRNSIVVMEVGA